MARSFLVGHAWVEDGKLYKRLCVPLRRPKRGAPPTRSTLPKYGVFDEKRVFGPDPCPVRC